jgi:hypothetical protein
MSTSPSPGCGIGPSINSKLPRLAAPSGRLLSKIWRLIIDNLLQVATEAKLMPAGPGEGCIGVPQSLDIRRSHSCHLA